MSTIIYTNDVSGQLYQVKDSPYSRHCAREGRAVVADRGFFVDWNGNTRMVDRPGAGLSCGPVLSKMCGDESYQAVEVIDAEGFVIHEAVYYPTLDALKAAGVTVCLVE